MPWTAPDVQRQPPPPAAAEREMLEAWLDFHRETLLWKCSGLTADQLRRRAVEPSNLSLLGLVRHMSDVERGWFRRQLGGEELPSLYRSDTDRDGDFEHVDAADAENDLATYQREVELARAAAHTRQLDDTFVNPRRQASMQVRWVYLHMIEEYARHNGHADLLRERIDGLKGA
ncbi:MAG: DinB family protein [Chloroflexi bacterium]|nr:DinB family protein [Chloroflexota bacterium]MBV9599087.1 DinB family protein [Chloroflexota bacterium]